MKKFLLYLSALVLIISLIMLSYFSDDYSNSYKNVQAAKADGAIESGWVPSIIPNSAYDIVEKHNLDTNVFYGSFHYKKEDEANFIKHLTPLKKPKDTYSWEKTLFYIDKKLRKVWYRNKAD